MTFLIGDIVFNEKIIVACFAALLLVFGGVSSAQADEYLRVGMELLCTFQLDAGR